MNTAITILILAIVSMIIGAIWYGPLFGKKWMRIMGVNPADTARIKEMRRESGKLYAIQIILVLIQLYIMAFYIKEVDSISGLWNGILIWVAFIMPTLAGSVMWSTGKEKRTHFFIMAGYQLLLLLIFGVTLGFFLG